MAENEILDVARSRRWSRTRDLLIKSASQEEVSACFAEELEESVRKALAGLQRGETLLLILNAAKDDPQRLKAAVESLKNRELAQIARLGIKVAGSDDPAALASVMTDYITAQVVERMMLVAIDSDKYRQGPEREHLRKELVKKVEESHFKISAVLEHSLRGERVARKHARSKVSKEERIKATASMSLMPARRP